MIWESQTFRNNTLDTPTPREQASEADLATCRSIHCPILRDSAFLYFAHAACEVHRFRNAFWRRV